MDEIQRKAEEVSRKISGEMDAHLVESIASLFNEGVLVHYVRSPRMNFDTGNCKMSVEAANGVSFEGRERIIELQQQNAEYRRLIKDSASVLKSCNRQLDAAECILSETLAAGAGCRVAMNKISQFLNRPEVKQILEEGE